VSVKVANQNGATDVSQVLAAIDWVVQHRRDNGLNIRVLNLSFGTDSTQPYTLDPLAYAAEVAWRKGIVVVVSAGNSGYGNAKLNDPASDPYVIAVGASDSNGTPWTSDDTVPSWSARGDSVRNPDLVAPGLHVVSLRDPGSYIDSNYSSGYVNDRFFRGSGTSEAAAVVSGAAALVLQQRPNATPDQVKAILTGSAVPLTGANQQAQGAGELNLKNAANGPLPIAVQSYPLSTGTGTLEGARGSLHVQDPNGNVLQGEQDIFGQQWNGLSWSGLSWSGLSWSGGTWNNSTWTGNAWSGLSWSGLSWSGLSWSGLSWSGLSWSGLSWSNGNWDGLSWSGLSWSGLSWSGLSWSGVSWSGVAWS
jgi:serine protease AprX